jgi:beta-lactamase superfamily II metal-dependent hydrolase
MNRRRFLQTAGALSALGASAGRTPALAWETAATGSTLPPWQPGLLDIHHINTGRGNSTLVVMPDATTLLIDAGASGTRGPAMNPARPDSSRRPGQWIARYLQRQLTAVSRVALDYALLTHFHGDHVGDVTPECPASTYGRYNLTGISDVSEVIPIAKLIDRGYPEYNYPARISDPTGLNYIEFVKSAAARGIAVERARVGSQSQIAQRRKSPQFPELEVRIVAGNGEVWNGAGESSTSRFPSQSGADENQLANENSCSLALRLRYGRFSYFTGGDLNCDTNYGRDPWRDIESPAAKVVGPVSVSTCNHHGYFDANGPDFVRALRPRVWILQSWHASHPALAVLANLYSPVLYPGPRDVFCLSLHPAAALSCARFSDRFKSSQGHVLVRVSPGGADYSVLVLEDSDESDRVKAAFGPIPS